MRIKRGFTLSEILIVLTVIGVIAAMTVPTMTKGVNEGQAKAGFKKAYSVISNVVGVEKANDNLPQQKGVEGLISFMNALNTNLDVEKYADSGEVVTNAAKPATYYGKLTYGATYGDAGTVLSKTPTAAKWSPWVITSDGMAYSIYTPAASGACSSKSALLNSGTQNPIGETCLTIAVDTNGLHKTPNMVEPQTAGFANTSTRMSTLIGDRFYIYIGKDGISKGNDVKTLSGRILLDKK